jgi:chromosomal replication initiation ATPase DnaA
MTSHFNLLDPVVRRALKNGQNPDVARKWERTWYDVDQAKTQLRALDTAPSGGLSSQEKRLQQILRRMLLNDEEATRQVGMPPHPNALQALKTSHPNFVEVVDHVLAQQALMRTRHALPRRLQPMLLLGSPGIGKTSFVQALAAAMQA